MTRQLTPLVIVLGLVIAPLAAEKVTQYRLADTVYTDAYQAPSELELLAERVVALEAENAEQQQQINLLAGVNQALDEDLASAEEELETLGEFLQTSGDDLKIQARVLTLKSEQIELDAPDVEATGEVRCDTLTTDMVESAAYTPGAGNIW